VKVYNLTDIKTPVLEQRGLSDQGIAIAGRIVNPGEFVDVEDTPTSRGNLAYLLQVGAVAIDQLPPPYVLARQQAQASAGGPRMRQHVEVGETKVAGEPPLSPPAEGEQVTLGREELGPPDPPPPPEERTPPPMAEDPPPNQVPVGGQSKQKKNR